ncbi:glycosyltransferase family 4 protein [Halomarina ordinaria]|uniref:Glycosyltransferase family 4 protein n=1 Tax=Halomarina ordinaria TaxID=3033939 RepID=A0ABD5U999_9EURY|nr:glycosyltransferase family 4 protein [Halomarina sp. PSRA2]
MNDEVHAGAGGRRRERLSVLGFTELRPEELRDPLLAADARATVVELDPDRGVPSRCYRQAVDGVRALRGDRYDAVLVYNGAGPMGLVAAGLARAFGVPLVVRANGDLLRQHRERAAAFRRERVWTRAVAYAAYAFATWLTYRLAAGVVPVATSLEPVLARQSGLPPERVRAVPGPLRPGRTPRASDGGDGETLSVLSVTNLGYEGKYRGARAVLTALAPVLRAREEVELVVAGDGRYLEDLCRDRDRLFEGGVRERVRLPGFVDDVAACYAAADVFCYASDIDGYPNVVLEAQAAGLPVVATPTYGVTEQVTDGETGVLVPATDRAAMREAVERLLADPDERERLGRNGAERVARENDPAVVGERLVAAVAALVGASLTEGEAEGPS